jgi:hypothetical protein
MIVPMNSFPQVPMRFVASYSDTTAHQEINTDAFRARLAGASWPVENSLIEYVGAHTASNSFKKQDIVDFFNRSTPIYGAGQKYRLLVRTTGLPAPDSEFVLEGGVLKPLVWSATVPTSEPSEYVRPQ